MCVLGLAAMAAAWVMPACETMPNGNNNGNDNSADQLFVVNNSDSVISFAAPLVANGNQSPATDLPVGAETEIFQPRSVVVTVEDVLIVSRQNGGITLHDDALTRTSGVNVDIAADRIVDGNDTLLISPISFAYYPDEDMLFVGNIDTPQGILVFDRVSDQNFDGNIAPDRTISPPDRAPTTNSEMTVDALDLDGVRLFASDTSGLNQNSSRILVFEDATTADGTVAPSATLTSAFWGGIEDLVVDNNVLYVVDGTAAVKVFDDADGLDGPVIPDRTLTVNVGLASIDGIVLHSDGTGFLADSGNHAIYVYEDLATRDGILSPDRTISGNDTELFSPRQMFMYELVP